MEIPACSIRKITEKHAEKISDLNPKNAEVAKTLIAEIDGGMVPIVEIGEKINGVDLRKTRKVCWKEAKLCFARDYRKIGRVYAAVIGTPEEAGEKLYECAVKAGLDKTTQIHALGDGAQWIVDQIENQFGSQANFLVDFFHMSEYLAGASAWCNILNPQEWPGAGKNKNEN